MFERFHNPERPNGCPVLNPLSVFTRHHDTILLDEVGEKRKRESRQIVKTRLLHPNVIAADRMIPCHCAQKDCPPKVAEGDTFLLNPNQTHLHPFVLSLGDMFTLRRNLQQMNQSEETEWRRSMLMDAARMPAASRRITLGSASLCMYGFACLVGGSTYERVCYSTVKEILSSNAHRGRCRFFKHSSASDDDSIR